MVCLDTNITHLESRFALLQPFSGSRTTGNFKGQDGAIDIVVRTIDQHGLDAEDGKPCDHAVAEHRFNALLHAGNVFFGHSTTLDFTEEEKKKRKKRKKKMMMLMLRK